MLIIVETAQWCMGVHYTVLQDIELKQSDRERWKKLFRGVGNWEWQQCGGPEALELLLLLNYNRFLDKL